MFKKILLPTDLSENSKEAFSYAKELATKYDAEIHLVAVVQDPAELALFSVINQPDLISCDISKKIVVDLGKDLEKLGQEIGYPKLKPVVLEGEDAVHTTLLKYVAENNIDLVVISAKGKAGIRRFVLGSVSKKLIAESKIPVLMVPCN